MKIKEVNIIIKGSQIMKAQRVVQYFKYAIAWVSSVMAEIRLQITCTYKVLT